MPDTELGAKDTETQHKACPSAHNQRRENKCEMGSVL